MHDRHQFLDSFLQNDNVVQEHREGDFCRLVQAPIGLRRVGIFGSKSIFVVFVQIHDGFFGFDDEVGWEKRLEAEAEGFAGMNCDRRIGHGRCKKGIVVATAMMR